MDLEEMDDVSYETLERYTYRNLQQIAKSVGLPSNVKKMYLIELIIAKRHCTQEQLAATINRVKKERQRIQSQNKRKKKKGKERLQSYEVSSSSQHLVPNQPTVSPSISATPKRSLVLEYSPELTVKVQQKKSVSKQLVPKFRESDRVLRSFNSRRPCYGIIECKDRLIKIVKAQNPVQVTQGIRASVLDISNFMPVQQNSNHTPQKRKRTVSGIHPLKHSENTYYEYVRSVGFHGNNGKVSIINGRVEKPKYLQQYCKPIKVTMQDVINRKVEDTISESPIIPAITYKPKSVNIEKNSNTVNYNIKDFQSNVPLVSNVINTFNRYGINTSQSGVNTSFNYGKNTLQTNGKNALNSIGTNIQSYETNITSSDQKTSFSNTSQYFTLKNTFSTFSNTYTNATIKDLRINKRVYYHQNIWMEQVTRVKERGNTLPRINEVFSKFNDVQYRSLMQPIYVQVGQESETFPKPIHQLNHEKTSMIERIFNIRLCSTKSQPLLKIATTSETKCVFTTTTAPTAVAQPPPAFNEYNNISSEQVNEYNHNSEAENRFYDYMSTAEQEHSRDFTCNEVLSPTLSMDTTNSQELEANSTIPEMVEDALELISQDGDYMERLGLDVKMQCILCDWAGPKIILEYHVKQTHQTEIQYKNIPYWTTVVTLGALVSHEIWLSNVVQYNENLYVISTQYTEDCISVILTILSEVSTPKHGQITIYNKKTGKPYTWEGEILPIPETLPLSSSFNCLKLEITILDLLPNSANLKLINKELKLVSDNKVIVGQPSLDNIDIVLHTIVFD